jgi:hypothetical protein
MDDERDKGLHHIPGADLAKLSELIAALQVKMIPHQEITESLNRVAKIAMPPISASTLSSIKSIKAFADSYAKQLSETISKIAIPSSALDAAAAAVSRFSDQYKTILDGIKFPAFEPSAVSSILMDFQASHAALLSVIATQTAIFTARLNSLKIPDLAAFMEGLFADYPANLQVAEARDYEWMTQILLVEGIALFRVPSPTLVRSLANLETPTARRAWLGRRLLRIIDDCGRLLAAHRNGPQSEIVYFLDAAMSAARAGHIEASQALLTNVIESLVSVLDESLEGLVRRRSRPKNETVQDRASLLEDYGTDDWLALLPLLSAYLPFHVSDGDSVPRVFSRHASTHAVVRRQFSKRNTAQALLCATSLAAYLYEWPDIEWDN